MLESSFLAPYREGRPITVNGRTVPMEKLLRIRISASNESSRDLVQAVREEIRLSGVRPVGGPSVEWLIAAKAQDVTDQYITGPPGDADRISSLERRGTAPAGPGDRKSLFLVAGRDNPAIAAVKALIRALRIKIVEWGHAVDSTGVPNPYIGDVILEGMKLADATLVLFTPDDVVQLRRDLWRDDDPHEERQYMGQARPNVLYEAGIAEVLGRKRTIMVEVGRVKPFTDTGGRHVIRLDGNVANIKALVDRMKTAGLDPDTSGTDWLTVGDVAMAIKNAKKTLAAYSNPEKLG
jgi:predicted nucleotide-binding protein